MEAPAISEITRHRVNVIYNGLTKALDYNPEAAVEALLQQAIRTFGISANPHLLGLFTMSGTELQDKESAEKAGVSDNDTLLLRPSAVRGG